jgi:multidrug resistance efflux pump
LREKEQVLAELRESCAQLEAKANDAADRLKSQEESIAKLQAILAEKEEELSRLASQADEGQGHEEVKDDAHSDKSQVEGDMAKDNRESRESYKEVVMELQQLQHNCDKLTADLREKAAELRAEERRIRELEQSEVRC